MSKNKTQALVICGHGSSLNLYKKDFEIAKRKLNEKFKLTVLIVFIEKIDPLLKTA